MHIFGKGIYDHQDTDVDDFYIFFGTSLTTFSKIVRFYIFNNLTIIILNDFLSYKKESINFQQ